MGLAEEEEEEKEVGQLNDRLLRMRTCDTRPMEQRTANTYILTLVPCFAFFLSLSLVLLCTAGYLAFDWYAHIEYHHRLDPFGLRSFTPNQRCLSSGDAEEVHRTH